MFAIIKDDKLIGFCDYEITKENMEFDSLIEGEFDVNKLYEYINGEIKEIIQKIDIELDRKNEINLFKEIEGKAKDKRQEYLTAELLPDGVFRTMKLEKITKEGDEIKAEYENKMQELISKYGESILNELI